MRPDLQATTTSAIPNPGSDEAVRRGCTCPVMDNARGAGWMRQEGVFWINDGCPLHAPRAQGGGHG